MKDCNVVMSGKRFFATLKVPEHESTVRLAGHVEGRIGWRVAGTPSPARAGIGGAQKHVRLPNPDFGSPARMEVRSIAAQARVRD